MQAMLEIAKNLFAQLEKKEILHCHWKSNQHLKDALSGLTDIDLLVEAAKVHEVETILLQLGFKKVFSQSWCRYPGLEDWIGFDADSGRLVHIHLHLKLLMGRQFVKDLHLPIEKIVLESAVKDDQYGVYITDPNLEMILLLIRVALKTSFVTLLSGLAGKQFLPDNILKEVHFLKPKIAEEQIQSWASKLFDEKATKHIISEIKEGLLETPISVYRLKQFTRRSLKDYYRISWLGTNFVYFHRKFLRLISRLIHKYHLPTQRQKILENGGVVIAFVGCDGSGKSTVASEILNWLSWKNDVEYFYMGSGEGKVGFFTNIKQRLNKYVQKNNSQNKLLFKSIREKNMLRATLNHLLLSIFNFALAKERQRKVLQAFRCKARGKIVVTDRYPQNEFESIYDGPQIRIRDDTFINLKLLKKIEKGVYHRLSALPPDLVIKLNVPLEVSRARKPDENFEIIKRKINITEKIKYNGTHIINIDASRPLDRVLHSVKAAVWSSL